MTLFDFDDYKSYVEAWIMAQPKAGHGQFRKMARALKTSSTIISQVFRGDRDLTLEQASALCDHLSLTELESDYLMYLVILTRAGTIGLRQMAQKKLSQIKRRSQSLKSRIPHDATLGTEARATFYSHWYFSAIRNLVAIPGLNSVDSISSHLDLPRPLVQRIIDFLLKHRLCVESGGKLKVGPKHTHLAASSLLVSRHHANWRFKAVERHGKLTDEELAYTSTMSLSKDAAVKIRRDLLDAIQKIQSQMADSPSETAYFLNVDWIRF